jgi:hypothetical protein
MTPYTHYEITAIHQAELRHQREAIREAKLARRAESGDVSVFSRWTTAIRLHLSPAKMVGAGLAELTKARSGHHTVPAPVKQV